MAEQLIELAMVDCAAAKMAAITSPVSPTGSPVDDEVRERPASPVIAGGQQLGPRRVEREQRRADEEEHAGDGQVKQGAQPDALGRFAVARRRE